MYFTTPFFRRIVYNQHDLNNLSNYDTYDSFALTQWLLWAQKNLWNTEFNIFQRYSQEGSIMRLYLNIYISDPNKKLKNHKGVQDFIDEKAGSEWIPLCDIPFDQFTKRVDGAPTNYEYIYESGTVFTNLSQYLNYLELYNDLVYYFVSTEE